MDYQNFKNAQNHFPLSTDTLDFMQNQSLLLQGLTSVLGDNYIIKQPALGGVKGLIVINGELLPLEYGSGINSSHIAVITETTDINANGLTFLQARTVRYAIGVGTNQGGECYPRTNFVETSVKRSDKLNLQTRPNPSNASPNDFWNFMGEAGVVFTRESPTNMGLPSGWHDVVITTIAKSNVGTMQIALDMADINYGLMAFRVRSAGNTWKSWQRISTTQI